MNIKNLPGYSKFVKECKFHPCKGELMYGDGWTGSEKYIIASDQEEKILIQEYPDIMRALTPYLFLSAEIGTEIGISIANSKKYFARSSRHGEESLDDSYANQSEGDELLNTLCMEEALAVCTPSQRNRIVRHYIDGISQKEIAEEENVAIPAVNLSIKAGLRAMKKYFLSDT